MAHEDHPMKLTGPEAHRLADMAGIADDLSAAAWAARRLRTETRPWVNDKLIEALQDSALIRYGRVFNKGARDGFRIPTEWLNELPEELQEVHKNLLLLRNAHIAHSANDWEMNVPTATLRIDPGSDDFEVHSVTVEQSRVVEMARWLSVGIERIAEIFLQRIAEERTRQEVRLLEIANATPLEELKRRIVDLQHPDDFPRPGKIGKRRPRE